MALEIPAAAEEPISRFISYNRAQIERLVSALREASPCVDTAKLALQVGPKAGIDSEELEVLVDALIGMQMAAASAGRPLDEFVDDLSVALQKKDNPALIAEDWDLFKKNLLEILSINSSLGVSGKAFDVLTENEKSFHSARIMTDIRPVFAEDIENAPDFAVVIHMLNLFYHENGVKKRLSFALDSLDLEKVEQLIVRAKTKEQALRAALHGSKLKILETK